MRIIAYGDIMDHGRSAFTSVASMDGGILKITFIGEIRIDSPYLHLENYIGDLRSGLPKEKIESVVFDFRDLSFCNSNGFYVIMDITEMVVNQSRGPILVQRLSEDDWHQETLPILLNADEPNIARRITFEQHDEL